MFFYSSYTSNVSSEHWLVYLSLAGLLTYTICCAFPFFMNSGLICNKHSKCLQQLGLYKTFTCFPFNLSNETENQIPYKGSFIYNISKINFSKSSEEIVTLSLNIILKMRKFIVLFFLILFLFNCNADNTISMKQINYNDGQQKLNGISIIPAVAKKNKLGILILPAWMGIDKHAKNSASQLAKMGYYTFIADIYGEGNYPKNWEEAGKNATYFKTHIIEYRNRIQKALKQLILSGANPNEIVVIGYCFGGTGALEAARANMPIKGVVSFHGGLSRDTLLKIEPIHPKVLVCHGADDFFESNEEIQAFQHEMRAANADWQMIYYSNAVHAFTDPDAGNDKSKGVAYNENAAKRSWKAMLDFFDEIFNSNGK
jgi:dienelactone hydrolase